MAAVIGCDVGSQSLKGVLIGATGDLLAEASAPYGLSFPHPGWAEQDPNDWLFALRSVVKELLDGAGVRPGEVGTIGFATQVDGVVAVGPGGGPLRPAIIWMDRRAEAQSRALRDRVPAGRVFEVTGLNLDSSHVAPKILWLREEEPEVYRSASAFLLPGSYLVYRLTGEKVVDYSNASSSMLYDVRKKDWSEEMLAVANLDPALLGRVAPADEVAGTLTEDSAREIGLRAGTRVVVGCGDEHGACLGAGLVEPDLVCDITGTAEPVAVAADEPVFDGTGLVETHAHADPRLWLIENPGFVSGGSIRWYSDNVARTDYDALTAEAEDVPPGSEGLIFLPCLSGAMTPTWNGNARGVFYGLSMKHGRGHMTRAVFEGCAYGFRDIVDRFGEMGLGGEEVRVVGGGAKSPFWCQIKADVTGRVLRALKIREATATGAAMLAGVAEGVYGSLEEAAACLIEFGATYEPDPDKKDAYEEAYGLYRAAYAALEPVFDREEATAW
ncbi:Xylulose kinase [Rubrobacter xylanophilus DSM 9941]|uniref:xylulokinase n=1 Tax=Rubrobacter xylanophilus TaxID=49319 RepID=UPI001C641533|nr:xylulokinase [Rubrobacter xylanophilus]QYJ16071.1 Xylulose kinase [Rubrobacter xylanophilus DSM 9941]